MNNLTAAVMETLESDAATHRSCLLIAKTVAADVPSGHLWKAAERAGTGICTWLGERLSGRFVTIRQGDIHDLLWMTFMGQVNWTQIGEQWLLKLQEES